MAGIQWSDSVTGGAPSAASPIVGGYLDGEYGPTDPFGSGWSDAAWALYPHAFRAYITVAGTPGLGGPGRQTFFDMEAGAMTIAQSVAWSKAEIAAGRRPGGYAAWSDWPALDAALGAAGLARVRDLDAWVAWIGPAVVPPGFVARQYAQNVAGPNGHAVDLSITDNVWPYGSVPPAPGPIPLPSTTREDFMPAATQFANADIVGAVGPDGIFRVRRQANGGPWEPPQILASGCVPNQSPGVIDSPGQLNFYVVMANDTMLQAWTADGKAWQTDIPS